RRPLSAGGYESAFGARALPQPGRHGPGDRNGRRESPADGPRDARRTARRAAGAPAQRPPRRRGALSHDARDDRMELLAPYPPAAVGAVAAFRIRGELPA